MQRRFFGSFRHGLLAALLIWLGCSSIPPHPQVDVLESGFSGRLANAHFRSIGGLYPRYPDSQNDTTVRGYLTREFDLLGAEVRILVEGERRHLVAEFPGDSEDAVLFVAAYPSLGSGEWIDDSGAAILLELARVLGRTRAPYRLRFALAETRPEERQWAHEVDRGDSRWSPITDDRLARERLLDAGHSLARGIEAEGDARGIRAVLVFDTSAGGRRRFERDLHSHPEFRRLFWQSAADLGFESTFPADVAWTSPKSLHLGFRERSMDRVLALVHEDVVVGPGSNTILAAGEVSPGMFESIGAVAVDAVPRLMGRLEKVDAFSR